MEFGRPLNVSKLFKSILVYCHSLYWTLKMFKAVTIPGAEHLVEKEIGRPVLMEYSLVRETLFL